MTNYEIFKENVISHILEYIPPKYNATDVKVISDIFSSYERISIIADNGKILGQYPLDELYSKFNETHDYDMTFKKFSENYFGEPLIINISYNFIKENSFRQLINLEHNAELLEKLPYKIIGEDMAMVYRYHIEIDGEFGSEYISKEMLEKINMTEKELDNYAEKNTPEIIPFTLKSTSEMFEETLARDNALGDEGMKKFQSMNKNDDITYILSSEPGLYGAIHMLDEQVLKTVADRIQRDFFVLPVNTDDVVVSIDDRQSVDNFKIILERLEPDDVRLSKQVYHYNYKKKKLEIADEQKIRKERGTESRFYFNTVSRKPFRRR